MKLVILTIKILKILNFSYIYNYQKYKLYILFIYLRRVDFAFRQNDLFLPRENLHPSLARHIPGFRPRHFDDLILRLYERLADDDFL